MQVQRHLESAVCDLHDSLHAMHPPIPNVTEYHILYVYTYYIISLIICTMFQN